jgi:hypothetical protein
MEFYEAVSARHTVRDFLDEPVDDAVLRRILSAGMKAPTNDHLRTGISSSCATRKRCSAAAEIPEEFSREEVDAVLRDWNLNDPCQRRAYQDAIPKQHRMLAQAACVIVPLFLCTTDLMHPASLSHLNGLASIWCCLENIFLASAAEGLGCALRIPWATKPNGHGRCWVSRRNTGCPALSPSASPTTTRPPLRRRSTTFRSASTSTAGEDARDAFRMLCQRLTVRPPRRARGTHAAIAGKQPACPTLRAIFAGRFTLAGFRQESCRAVAKASQGTQ